MKHFAKRLRSARSIRGYSLQDLADKLGNVISKQALSKYEQDLMKPSSELLLSICDALDVRPDYFSREPKADFGDLDFGKTKLTPREQQKVVQQTIDFLERYIELEEILGIEHEINQDIGKLPVQSNADVETIVTRLRELWHLGSTPLFNIIRMLEDRGIKVMEVDAPAEFSGMSTWVNEIPVMVINSNLDDFLDRKRFTSLHELAHLIMPQIKEEPFKIRESYCNYFAAAMLMPAELFRKELGPKRNKILFNELAAIKKQYGISYQAIIYRARDLGIITDSYHRQFMFMMNTMNMKINEPVKYTGYEKSNRFIQLLHRAVAEEIISASKAAALNNQKLADFRANIS